VDVLLRLRRELAGEGLLIVRPVSARSLERAGLGWTLQTLLPGARAGLVLGDGGGGFFARFRARPSIEASDPLDRFTAEVVPAAVARALAGLDVRHAIHFPSAGGARPWPVQRVGEAAGLPAAGPLGLQIHPVFGPWWAYRAVVAVSCDLPEEAPLEPPCRGCSAPCVTACPGSAVTDRGFLVGSCVAHRLAARECQSSCGARLRCVRGPEHAYPEEQLGFHMTASLTLIRAAGARQPGRR
jgi:hypothetical protein